MDHSSGAYLFDEVYIPRLDEQLYIKHNGIEKRTKNIESAKKLGLIDETYNCTEYINKNYVEDGKLKLKEINND